VRRLTAITSTIGTMINDPGTARSTSSQRKAITRSPFDWVLVVTITVVERPPVRGSGLDAVRCHLGERHSPFRQFSWQVNTGCPLETQPTRAVPSALPWILSGGTPLANAEFPQAPPPPGRRTNRNQRQTAPPTQTQVLPLAGAGGRTAHAVHRPLTNPRALLQPCLNRPDRRARGVASESPFDADRLRDSNAAHLGTEQGIVVP
jgi:hypothetical protein